jgi:hypothetical protein
MSGMAKHSEHYAAGAPARRARAWAWGVFWLTAGTSVLYNCYHALVGDHMPWYTGAPEGVAPLVVAIGVLEFSGAWRENKALQVAAWLVTGGAMAWSAIAINAVVHYGWAFGLIGDTAALSAMYFLLNGPTAAQAVAAMDRKMADLTAAANAQRLAREQEEAAHRTAMADLKARADAAIGKLRADGQAALSGLRDELTAELARRDRALGEAGTALAAARSEADKSAARAAVLERKLGGPARRSRTAAAPASTALRTGTGTASEDDLDLEARALKLLATNLDMGGAELARELGISPGYGRKLRRRLAGDRSAEDEPDRPDDRDGTASEDRSEDRA